MVLKMRCVGGHQVLSLFDESKGTIALPREWTDQIEPSLYSTVLEQAPILDAACLLKLHELVKIIKKKG